MDSCAWLLSCDEYRAWDKAGQPVQDENDEPVRKKLRLDGEQSEHLMGMAGESMDHPATTPSQFLWVKGNPGVGKSTLMAFALDKAEKTRTNERVLSHFFHARGVELERSIEGLYRTLLHQLIDDTEASTLDALPRGLLLHNNTAWPIAKLENLLLAVVNKLKQGPMTWFVDALDECPVDEVRKMLRLFSSLVQKSRTRGNQLRICLASRHYPTIRVPHAIELTVETQPGHMSNVLDYIDSHLMIGSSPLAHKIRKAVRDKARGAFIWVRFVVDILQDQYDPARIETLEACLQNIPPDLNDLYVKLLRRGRLLREDTAEDQSWQQTRLCMQLVFCAFESLYREEACWALCFAAYGPSGVDDIWQRLNQDPDGLDRYILNVSKGLVETVSQPGISHAEDSNPENAYSDYSPTIRWHIQFVHESVRDFLQSRQGSLALDCSGQDFELQAHRALKRLCRDVLKYNKSTFTAIVDQRTGGIGAEFNGIARDTNSDFGWFQSFAPDLAVDDLDREMPFGGYAILHILDHANEELSRLPGAAEYFLREIDREYWICAYLVYSLGQPTFSPNMPWLYILCELGLGALISHCPELSSQRQRYGYALCPSDGFRRAPIDRSHLVWKSGGTLQALFAIHMQRQLNLYHDQGPLLQFISDNVSPREDINFFEDQLHRSMLISMSRDLISDSARAARVVKEKRKVPDLVAVLFLVAQIPPEKMTPKIVCTLNRLAGLELSFSKVLECLICEHQLQLPISDAELVLYASMVGLSDLVQMLLARGAPPNCRDLVSDDTPLHIAIRRDYTNIVELLLQTENIDINARNNAGDTPMMLTCKKGRADIARLLVNTGFLEINGTGGVNDSLQKLYLSTTFRRWPSS